MQNILYQFLTKSSQTSILISKLTNKSIETIFFCRKILFKNVYCACNILFFFKKNWYIYSCFFHVKIIFLQNLPFAIFFKSPCPIIVFFDNITFCIETHNLLICNLDLNTYLSNKFWILNYVITYSINQCQLQFQSKLSIKVYQHLTSLK